MSALHANADRAYRNAASGTKAQANMASKTSKTEPEAVSLAEFGRDLLRRRAETGIADLPRNSGKRRTPSKRALLKAIEEAGGKW
jgi:hypothetical protein